MAKKAIIAMSGGVDSSVAAWLVQRMGMECIGMTMKLHDEEAGRCEKSCCSLSDVEDARSVAYKLGIPYYVLNFKTDFNKEIISRFVNTYIEGGTPNPCIDCNRFIKFQKLMDRMYELGYDYIVTGHYARIAWHEESGRYLLKNGLDESKDQSYVLYSLTQEQLAHILFPLGDYEKEQIREIAQQQGFVNAQKKDSQDICFVPDGDYAGFIERYCGRQFEDGDFVRRDGTVVGRHRGIIRYTIGQRRGLGLSLPRPLYVCQKDVANNRVILGEREELYQDRLEAGDVNLIAVERLEEPVRCKAKIRYRQKADWAIVSQKENGNLLVEFEQPQRGIAPGQAVVLYQDDIVLGGGTILQSGCGE